MCLLRSCFQEMGLQPRNPCRRGNVVDYLTKVRKFHRPQEKYKCKQEVDKNSQEVRIISRVVNVLHYTFFKSICM